MCGAASDKVLTGWLLLVYNSVMRLLIFPRSTKSLRRPLGLRCAKIGLAYLENGKVVMIPYLCMSANSTVISSLRLMGVGRFWLLAGLSSFGVSFTLNSRFMPMSKRCLAKMSWISTRISSISCRSSGLSVVSDQSKFERNVFLDVSLSFGFSFSRSCSSRSSL